MRDCSLTTVIICCASGGWTAGSVAHWERVARWFLAERSQPLEDALWQLTTGEVTRFVVARCAPWHCSGSTAKILTGGLRSLLRYLHVAGSPRSRWRRRCHEPLDGG